MLTLSGVFGMQGMDTISLLEINQEKIDEACEQLVSLNKRRKYLRPLAIAAIAAGVGYGVKKLWWDTDQKTAAQVDKALEGSGIANMNPNAQQMLLLAMLEEREAKDRLNAAVIANKTYWQSTLDGIADYAKWLKTNIPWTIGTGLAYSGVTHAQTIISDVLPVDKIVDNFTSASSIAWYCENRTKYNLSRTLLLDTTEKLALQLRQDELSTVSAGLSRFDAIFESGQAMSDDDIDQYNQLVARLEELNAITQFTCDEIAELANDLLVNCALYIRELEKIIGYVQYHKTVLEADLAKDTANASRVLWVKKNIGINQTLRASAKVIVNEVIDIARQKNASRTHILAIQNALQSISKALKVYAMIEN